MENDIYNQNEIKFFTDIYNYLRDNLKCDTSGNIIAQDIHEFLLGSSKLTKDVILQIGEVSGGTFQGWYGEKQLFLALKLVAAAQQGIPITSEIPLLEIDLPLPDLFINNNTHYGRKSPKEVNVKESSPNLIHLSDSDCPPQKDNDNGYQIMMSEDVDDDFPPEGIYSEPTSNFTSQSPSVSSPASDSPTPTNSGHDKHWTQPILNSQWHIIVNEEHHQLLGTEEESSDRHSSEGKDEVEDDDGGDEEEEEEEEEDEEDNCEDDKDEVERGASIIVETEKELQKEEVSLKRRREDDGIEEADKECDKNEEEEEPIEEEEEVGEEEEETEDDDVWTMTEEQQQYYTRQFTMMQPDLSGFLPGNVAKQFFEKSKLPVSELRQIWQLADVSRDGALSLEEFFAAMHLVVLRRNKIPLPEKLPKALMPKSFKWTKFADSPTSTLSSPGPKPVNFDFHKSAVEKDPKILHPTPLRVTPESKRLEANEDVPHLTSHELEAETSNLSREPYSINFISNTYNFKDDRNQSLNLQQKHKAGSAKTTIGSLQSVKHVEESGSLGPTSLPPFSPISTVPPTLPHPPLPLKDIPPPPPPRPARTHVRSSSLDLNKFSKFSKAMAHKSPPPPGSSGSPNVLMKKQSENGLPSREPRIGETQEELGSGSHLRNSTNKHSHSSAFEVYKKPYEEEKIREEKKTDGVSEEEGEEEPQLSSLSSRQNDKREILSSLQTLKEKNAVLLRVNSELNQELAEVMEERIGLEFQLEQMKSFSS